MSPVFYYKYSLSDGVWKVNISAKNRKKVQKNLQVSKKCVPLHPRSRKTHKTEQIGAVVQLVRISACHAGGRGFESRPHRKKDKFF